MIDTWLHQKDSSFDIYCLAYPVLFIYVLVNNDLVVNMAHTFTLLAEL